MMLTIKEAAERLKVSPSFVYNLVARGTLPSYRIGSCRRVSEEDLLEYLKNCRRDVVAVVKSVHRHF